MNIAEKLRLGSREIDRLREEIKETVNIVIGFAKQSNYLRRARECTFRDPDAQDTGYRWVISCNEGILTGKTDFEVKFLVNGRMAYNHSIQGSCPAQFTKTVHENLPTFVAAMIMLLLDIEQKWQPLIVASESTRTPSPS